MTIQRQDECKWTYSEEPEFCYETSCNEKFQFFDGDMPDNGYNYCPNCGGLIEIINEVHND